MDLNQNMMKYLKKLSFLLAMIIIGSCSNQKENPDGAYLIIPEPASLVKKPGQFKIDNQTTVSIGSSNAKMAKVASYFASMIEATSGHKIQLQKGTEGSIQLEFDDAITNPEAYKLSVNPDKIILSAGDTKGLFYGVQTLRQLLPESIEGGDVQDGVKWTIPAVEIEDSPRFKYRGMHLDVGRHFFPAEFIKKYIDLIAMHKMNTFHWHLTEDQGWRIEIKKYPKLTEVGAWRDSTLVGHLSESPRKYDGQRYGGFYTQEEIKEIVAYAADRSVTVIPEIELPGHSSAALTAYPELGDTGGPYRVEHGWGVFPDIYSPKEETFEFLENVLLEVMELFPSKYIHIGGDEAPKDKWKVSPIAQEVIKLEGLEDEHGLQSYFIQRMEKFLNKHGRQIIGWDEILEGGLAPNATVMSWRGEAGGIEAAKQHHDVIMTPTGTCYFDYYQSESPSEPLAIGGYLPVEKVYAYEPVPEELTAEEAKYILGAQGNVWTEYMKTSDHVEYMILPRMTALSEVLWSPGESRDWEKFLRKLDNQNLRYDALDLNYFVHYPDLIGVAPETVFLDEEKLAIENPIENSKVHYTTDGNEPNGDSPIYTEPIAVSKSTTFKLTVINAEGETLKKYTVDFVQKTYKDAVDINPTKKGLNAKYYEGNYNETAQIQKTNEKSIYVSHDFGFPKEVRPDHFGLVFEGFVKIEKDGLYTFYTASDDGSVLFIGDDKVVDNDFNHGHREKSGQVFLRKGFHPIKVLYFEGSGGNTLEVHYSGSGIEKQELGDVLFRE